MTLEKPDGDRMPQTPEIDRLGAAPFERYADRYDAWFETDRGRGVFQLEVEALRDLLADRPRPWLEVGVGTGRFAHALGVDDGIDASAAVLRFASLRGIPVRQGPAEELPYPDRSFGVALLIVTICFVDDPRRAMTECRRILRDEGCMIVGLVPKDSRWGRAYAREGAAGHTFYSAARFYTVREVIHLAEKAGFRLDRANSTLSDAPGRTEVEYEPFRAGVHKDASFVALRFACTGQGHQHVE